MTRIQLAARRIRGLRAGTLIAASFLALLTACGGQEQSDGGIASAGDVPPASQESGAATPSPSSGKSAFFDAQLKYVQCMRRTGIPNWPDPKLSGYPNWPEIELIQAELQSGPDAQQGQEKLANSMRACMPEMQAADALQPQRDVQKDYESMLEHAKCMRNNGVSGFANPTMQGGQVVPGGESNPTDPSVPQDSPVYKRAREACKTKLLDGLDGMQ